MKSAIIANTVHSFGFTTLITLFMPAVFGEFAWFTFEIYKALSLVFAVILLKLTERNEIIYN